MAAKRGAVACLVRSVTANSLRSPHTGAMSYGDAAVKIPAAAVNITLEEEIGLHITGNTGEAHVGKVVVDSADVVFKVRADRLRRIEIDATFVLGKETYAVGIRVRIAVTIPVRKTGRT